MSVLEWLSPKSFEKNGTILERDEELPKVVTLNDCHEHT